MEGALKGGSGFGVQVEENISTHDAGAPRKVDARPPGKGNSNLHGARPVHLITTMIKWLRTSRLSAKKSLLERQRAPAHQKGWGG